MMILEYLLIGILIGLMIGFVRRKKYDGVFNINYNNSNPIEMSIRLKIDQNELKNRKEIHLKIDSTNNEDV